MEKEKVVLLLSGGLDSVTLAHYLVKIKDKEVIALFFDYGQEFVAKEFSSVLDCIEDLKGEGYPISLGAFAKISNMPVGDNGYIPQRNTILLSYAAQYAEKHGIREIYAGLVDSSEFGLYYVDCSPGYIENFNRLLSPYNIEIKAPFIHFDKRKVYSSAYYLGVNLNNIWSCNFPEKNEFGNLVRCGECDDCTKADEFITSSCVVADLDPLKDAVDKVVTTPPTNFKDNCVALLITLAIIYFVWKVV